MKSSQLLLLIREIQVKTLILYHFIPTVLATIQNKALLPKTRTFWQGCGENSHANLSSQQSKTVYLLWKTVP